MQVFGDATHSEPVARKLGRLRRLLDAAQAAPPGIGRHGDLVCALIEAGELAQGIADAQFHANGGHDAPSEGTGAAMSIALMLARCCAHSWNSGLRGTPAPAAPSIDAWAACLPAIDITVRQAEGHAFYALYPECYLAAARRMHAGPWRVIGLRSIGTGLAAVVAAVLGDPQPVTLRPVGHPFDRRIAWQGPPLALAGVHHAIVDEGPGLSGSSMAAVVRQLRAEGAAPGHIHLFPAHARGPGAQASPEVRALWSASASHTADFDDVILHAPEPAQRLQTWVESCVGPLRAPLEDIGGGGWRRAHAMPATAWPSVHPWQERRKFLAHADSGPWLVKFAGLGHGARERIACAEALGRAGFCTAVAGACHGFMIERWQAAMTPISPARLADPGLRKRLVARVADYLAFRASRLPAPDAGGASLPALCDMGLHNSGEALGAAWRAPWARLQARAAKLQARVRPVRTDSRMQAWEWLEGGDRILKTDAVDHHAGHDLVGCQDVAWDVAGARFELALGDGEAAELLRALAARGCPIDPALLALYAAAYPAFQLGHSELAARDATDADERERLDRRTRHCAHALRVQLQRAAG